ncbi:MAG: hypothetical protein ACJ8EY_07900 [Sphingomicrobium sp.]
MQRIDTAKRLLADVYALLPSGMDIVAIRVWWKSRARGLTADKITDHDPQLMLRMFMLNRFLDQHFRKEHQRMMSDGYSEEKK